jgi:hypothetical protein
VAVYLRCRCSVDAIFAAFFAVMFRVVVVLWRCFFDVVALPWRFRDGVVAVSWPFRVSVEAVSSWLCRGSFVDVEVVFWRSVVVSYLWHCFRSL